MSYEIEDRVKALPALARPALLALWKELFGRKAPDKLRREVMVPILAYRMQEKAYGGLKASTRARLRHIGRQLAKDPSARLLLGPRIKPGTRLIRQWRGETHEVMVVDTGYEYRGKPFQSLSEIARQITGTRWSGPLFFGLRGLRGRQTVDGGRDRHA